MSTTRLVQVAVVCFFCVVPCAVGQIAAGPGQIRLGAGESLGVLRFTLRPNYVIPNKVTVEEGWYRIVVSDPHMISRSQTISLSDDGDVRLSSKVREDKSPKSVLYERLTPGKRKLRVGAKNEWVVEVTVTQKKAADTKQ